MTTAKGTAGIRVWDALSGRDVGRLAGHQGRITSLAFTPNGRRLVSGSTDTTALVWDVERLSRDAAEPEKPPGLDDIDALWADLGSRDPAKAWEAMRRWIAAPKQVAAFLRDHLRPVFARNRIAWRSS